MLYRSGENLSSGVNEYLATKSKFNIYSPYIITSKLRELLQGVDCELIVVRWEALDILNKACDFEELYEFTKEKGIELYRNPRIHLKVIEDLEGRLFFGSANVTNRGLGDSNFNWELSGLASSIGFHDKRYLDKIVSESHLVDESYYKELKSQIDDLRAKFKMNREKFSESPLLGKKNNKEMFLLSSLPMSYSPQRLWEVYSKMGEGFNREEVNCATHDLNTYCVDEGLNKEEFFKVLGNNFNKQPFASKLKQSIAEKRNGFMGYTEIIRWLQENTTTVPTPRRWEIKDAQKVQILHKWIIEFDVNYKSEIRHPNGSDKLIYIPKGSHNRRFGPNKNSLQSLVDSLRIVRARGKKAPHQIILLIAFWRQIQENSSFTIPSKLVHDKFEQAWKDYENELDSSNLNLGMPLKAFYRKEFVAFNPDLEIDKFRYDFRNTQRLLNEISSIKLKDPLISTLKQVQSEEELKEFLK